MLPILRIIPVGGVCIAVLIVLLAISPPRDSRQDLPSEMVLARGPLLDRRNHPEWPQLLVKAAFQRAGEILKLRDLPNTPTVTAPVPLPPAPPAVDAAVAPTPQPKLDAVKIDSAEAAPATAKDTVVAALPGNIDDMKSAAPASVPTALPPAPAAPAQASIKAGQSASFGAVCAPMTPPVVNPRWQAMMSAPALAIASASPSLKTYGVVSMSFSCAFAIISTSRP